MITVLHTESSQGWGGQESRTLHECQGLLARGARPIVLCQAGSVLAQRAAEAGIEVRTSHMRRSFDLFAIARIARLIQTEKVDIVNTHSGRDSLLAGLAGRVARRKPVIVRTRHLALPITSKMSYSVLPHRVVTVSEFVRGYLIERGVPAERVIAIPTGIDCARFQRAEIEPKLRQEWGIDASAPLVGTVAILRYKKGHHVLLDAIPQVLKAVPEARFVFAGDGPQLANLTAKIAAMNLDGKVFLLGLRRDIPSVLSAIDLFVLPTMEEALGTSYLEAMAMGKAVIGSDVGGVGEVVRPGSNGYLVPPNDPAALAHAIISALSDRERLQALGHAGRALALAEFSLSKMCDRMLALYTDLLAARL